MGLGLNLRSEILSETRSRFLGLTLMIILLLISENFPLTIGVILLAPYSNKPEPLFYEFLLRS